MSVLQLAARIAVSNLHKNTLKSFSETYVPQLLRIGIVVLACELQHAHAIGACVASD